MTALPFSDAGCSSGVEHNLAKVGVVGSNPIVRSTNANQINSLCHRPLDRRASAFLQGSKGEAPTESIKPRTALDSISNANGLQPPHVCTLLPVTFEVGPRTRMSRRQGRTDRR